MSLRIRYDPDDIQRLVVVAAFVLFVAFLVAVGPFWFAITTFVDMGEVR